MKMTKRESRQRIHYRIRKKVSGTASCPRLSVYRSLKGIYVQAIDDESGRTIAAASTVGKDFKSAGKSGGNIDAAKAVGEAMGKQLKEKGIEKAVFDRGGFRYHGRVKALADAVREAGIQI